MTIQQVWKYGLLLGLLLVGLTWPPAAQAHSGAPYPVLLEQAIGPYIVTALADPDVGDGTFIVQATLAEDGAVPAGTEVTVWVHPEDGHAAEASYQAQRQTARDEEQFIAKVPFDAEGVWQVRLVLEGPAGHGETTFKVQVTPPGLGWLRTLICLLPFIALGAVWLWSVVRRSDDRAPSPTGDEVAGLHSSA